MANKAWMDVPPTQSVPGTEDDETFFLKSEERKIRKAAYKARTAEMYRLQRNRWYVLNREQESVRQRRKRELRNMMED